MERKIAVCKDEHQCALGREKWIGNNNKVWESLSIPFILFCPAQQIGEKWEQDGEWMRVPILYRLSFLRNGNVKWFTKYQGSIEIRIYHPTSIPIRLTISRSDFNCLYQFTRSEETKRFLFRGMNSASDYSHIALNSEEEFNEWWIVKSLNWSVPC